MKTVVISRFGGPEVLEPREAPTPAPGPGEVLVRIRSIGIGAWDAMWYEGSYPYALPPPPFVPGQIAAGYVVAVGAGVGDLPDGAAVQVINLAGGAYAEYMTAPVETVTRLPDDIDIELAACLSDYRSAWSFFRDGLKGHHAQTVFMPHAAGGVGMAMIQAAKALAMDVVASSTSQEGRDLLKSWGADETLDGQSSDVVADVRAWSGGRGVDLVFDHLAGERFNQNFAMLAPEGMVFVLNRRAGAPAKNSFGFLCDRPDLRRKLRFWSMHVYDRYDARRGELMNEVVEMFQDGRFKPTRVNRRPLEEAALVHAQRARGELLGKTILIP
ncbi:zinc-binding alcohol dehydrogenase family protein [Phenylobacterium sp.]|uniref:quinone oxidoreductase family protein n=1 Tax=Phenylobacterium sp. TaxID=1871053 RepID=UPI0035B17672